PEDKPSTNGQPPKVRVIYRDGDIFDGKLDDNGKPCDGEMRYSNGVFYKGEFHNGRPSKGIMKCNNGDILDGKFENGRFSSGVIMQNNGDVLEGKWQNGRFYYGKITYSNGDVYKGMWRKGEPLNVSVEAKLSKIGKSYCLYRQGKNNLQREVKYCLKDDDDNIKAVTIDYGEINNILNGNNNIPNGFGNKINSLNDLIDRRVIEGVESFKELRDFAKEVLQDKMSGGIEEGFDDWGSHPSLEDLLLLSSIDTVEQLKKTRFQLEHMKGKEDNLREEYGSLKNFLESVGISNIDNVEEDYISLKANTIPEIHAVSVILDIKKMKDLMRKTGRRNLDEAIGSEKVIHCYDSSRAVGCHVMVDGLKTYFDMGALTKNCDFVNFEQQKLDSCWFHAVAATLTALKHPEIVKKIGDGEIELYDTRNVIARSNNKLNEFQLRQMDTIIEISEKFDIGPTKNGREIIDLIIRDIVKKRVEDAPIPNMTEGVLGTKIVNKIRETKNNKLNRSKIVREQPAKTNPEIDSVRKKPGFFHRIRLWFRNVAGKFGKSDFYHKIRLINKQYEKINRYREILENSRKVIEKRLEAEKKSMLYGARETSVDGIVMHYGRNESNSRNEPGTFTGELKKRRDSISEIGYKPNF
ncbi:MAG: hypothetical protein LBP39_03425, partial [Rickettsiales bacterium]|nr:hypothetical protein [Rickettsiales bacterium]